jgi:hypothetical protein
MRKHIGIGVVAAALLFGLAAPGLSGPARGNQVVAAGIGTELGEAIGRWFPFLLRFVDHDAAALRAATAELERVIPTVLRTPWGEQRELRPQQWLELVDVACKVKDVDEIWREQEIGEQLKMLEAELPGAAGAHASVRNLAEDMDEAKSTGDKVRIAATAGICATADKASG